MAVAEGAEPISLEEEQQSSPFRDAWRLFRRNKASLVALSILIVIFFIAITPRCGAKPPARRAHRRASRHTLNPVNLTSEDPYPDPGVCARDGLNSNPYWCSWLSPESLVSVQNKYCFRPEPDYSQKQWCYVLGGDSNGKDWLSQTVYGAQVSLAVGVVGATMSLVVGLIYGMISGYYGGRVDMIMMPSSISCTAFRRWCSSS